ncbi:MAG: hypothetical protein JXA11_07545 [Phycisphaerae bacterium]|nr:hypothetical protein [Phycisphaerae bacterium]
MVVFDFATPDVKKFDPAQTFKPMPFGRRLAGDVRLKLRREGKKIVVLDWHTTAEASGPLPADTPPETVKKLLAEKLGGHVGIFGTVHKTDQTVRAEIGCVDLRSKDNPAWSKVFQSRGERVRAILAKQIVETVLGKTLQQPVEYGHEPEPPREALGKPLNVNGSFDEGAKGWDAPDNVSTFLLPGPAGRGTILRVRTDLQRDPWLAYRKALRTGKANPANPPAIAKDTTYGSVAGLEGVHYRSRWIKATPKKRYWLLADCKHTTTGKRATPKVFVKGFLKIQKTPHAYDGLPESSLAEMNLTPEQFAALPEAKRRFLIEADVKKHPMRYVRECYRWYLSCPSESGKWNHFAAPFPPRGGLPEDVEYLQIQIYSYWPPGEYLWDNVQLHEAPGKK